MAIDFLQVRRQVTKLGEGAPASAKILNELREHAQEMLDRYANEYEYLQDRVGHVVQNFDPTLRCALPSNRSVREPEPLNASFPAPEGYEQATLLAADGSQISPDRHAEVQYGLINVGAIRLVKGNPSPPKTYVESHLFYGDRLYVDNRRISDDRFNLLRDLNEREILTRLAPQETPPIITFTDGPLELWGSRDDRGTVKFQRILDRYLGVLAELYDLGVITAGYVDKPAANLLVRLLEVTTLEEGELPDIRKQFPLRGVSDGYLYRQILDPGERSAVFELQSGSAGEYENELGLFFFYLNVGQTGKPYLARVEVPAWVVKDQEMLNGLHAALIDQCRIMGNRPYPYLLHRAHETAVVKFEEKRQVTEMIVRELYKRGVEVGELSYKQSAKDLRGKTRYQ